MVLLVTASPQPVGAQQAPDLVAITKSVVRVKATVPSNARSAETLGTERTGSGVVIDDAGLIVTIGYLIMEASEVEVQATGGKSFPADIVAYDPISGFGLLRGQYGFDAPAMRLGRSADAKVGDPMLAVSHGGSGSVMATLVVGKREFAGYWEYLLDEAIFTSPAHP